MRRRRICIVSGRQVIDNPRVVKEADALVEAGYDVTVLSAVIRPGDLSRIASMVGGRGWRHHPVVDLSDSRPPARLHGIALRALARITRSALSLGLEHPLQLSFQSLALLRASRETDADLHSLHADESLWAGTRLVSEGRPVRIDIEDWHSEDGLAPDRAQRPLRFMRSAERLLLNKAVHSTATSEAMADALVAAYGCPRPSVVYNSFPIADRTQLDGLRRDRVDTGVPSLTWFSQTIGPGRGLETLLSAVAALNRPVELHLRGNARAGYLETLLADVPSTVRGRIFAHPQVPQEELLSRIAEHDIGYCGELSDCASRDLTITNKVFEYMRAGLAIVASDTKGQAEVARIAPTAVRLFRQGDPAALRHALEPLLVNPEVAAAAKKASLAALVAHFSWEQSKQRILDQVAQFFGDLTAPMATPASPDRSHRSL